MPGNTHLAVDAYYLFLAVVLGGLLVLTAGMAAIAVWLFRRNRRLPHLVWRGPRRYSPFDQAPRAG